MKNKFNLEWNKIAAEYEKVKIECKYCGRKAVIPVWVDKQLCSWCGHYVYRNKNLEFKEKLKSKGVKVDVRKDQEKKYREA